MSNRPTNFIRVEGKKIISNVDGHVYTIEEFVKEFNETMTSLLIFQEELVKKRKEVRALEARLRLKLIKKEF